MKFFYKARTIEGTLKSGIIEAPSKEIALSLLQKSGLFVTTLEEEKPSILFSPIKIARVSLKELALFSRQLSVMIASRIPLVEALKTLAAQTTNSTFREAILDISNKVEGGESLSQAFSAYPRFFSPFFISIIRVGEKTGKLSDSFGYLGEYFERTFSTLSKTQTAFIYPGILMAVFIGVFFLLSFFVLPTFETIFLESGVELPLVTKIVLGFSRFLKKNFLLISLIFLALIFGLLFFGKSESNRKIRDKIFLSLPLFGKILKHSILVRFCDAFSTLVASGITILDALEVAKEVTGNAVYQEAISQVKDGVKKGYQMSTLFSFYPQIFPPIFVQMLLVGEKTGKIDEAVSKVGDFYFTELTRQVESLSQILEPLMIIFMGLLVGGLIGSVLIPLYKLIGTF